VTRDRYRFPNGTEPWLYGKGWGLDGRDFARDGGPRYALNEAALVVPNSICVVQDRATLDRIVARRPAMAFAFPSWAIPNPAPPPADPFQFSEIFWAPHCPTAPAFIAALGMAVERVHLVGFDTYFDRAPPSDALPTPARPTGRPYARCIESICGPLSRGQGADYRDINEQIRQAAFWTGLELVEER